MHMHVQKVEDRTIHSGSIRSLPKHIKSRICPNRFISKEVTIPVRAPTATTRPAHGHPIALYADEKGVSMSIRFHGTMPTIVTHMRAYRPAQAARAAMMPMGRSTGGLRVSSAAEATVSKPRNEKNTCSAPSMVLTA
jgi:hypothetical protein